MHICLQASRLRSHYTLLAWYTDWSRLDSKIGCLEHAANKDKIEVMTDSMVRNNHHVGALLLAEAYLVQHC